MPNESRRIPTVVLPAIVEIPEGKMPWDDGLTPFETLQASIVKVIQHADCLQQQNKRLKAEFPFRVAEQIFYSRGKSVALSAEQSEALEIVLAGQERGEPVSHRMLSETVAYSYRVVSEINKGLRSVGCKLKAKRSSGILCMEIDPPTGA